jgi:hypothetical protein
MNIRILLTILAFVLIGFSVIFRVYIRKKFYKKNLSPGASSLERRFFLALFFPKDYIEKNSFREAYLLYLLSIFLLILGFIAFYYSLTGGID